MLRRPSSFFQTLICCLAGLVLVMLASGAKAAESTAYSNERLTAVLLTAEDGVRPDASTLSGALYVDLSESWKTYWRSPGEVGYPLTIDWAGSENILDAEIFWPTPKRFVAFEVENYGYETQVVFPLRIALERPGEPARLTAQVGLLTCAEICVPENFELALDLPSGDGIDAEVAEEIARAVSTLPGDGSEIGLQVQSTSLSNELLQVSLRKDGGFSEDPSVFPDLGESGAFGAPEYDYAIDGSGVTVSLPVLSMPEDAPPLQLVVATPEGAAEFAPEISEAAVPTAGPGLFWVLGLAFLGGLILNIMPCVLPVLSIKLTSAMSMRDKSPARIRTGFLASGFGVLSFMWALALVLVSIRAAGGSVGWGIQFQSPVFLALMMSIMVLFAANMAGLFEITLPQGLMTRLSRADGSPGIAGDFATGALAAVLATPCSAPFLGTAVTIALAGATPLTFAIFTALGLGLALPYFLVALLPSLVSALPRPGRWMLVVKWVLAGLLLATAAWLSFVLLRISGGLTVAIVLAVLVLAVFVVHRHRSGGQALGIVALLLAVAVATPAVLQRPQTDISQALASGPWTAWQPQAIAEHVAAGQTVFVDVTADWCLTCKTNKTLVLNRAPVSDLLASDAVLAMQADWTRPNDSILKYLQDNGRFGIPFNIVYGPAAPEGIALPEILTAQQVVDAIAAAGAGN